MNNYVTNLALNANPLSTRGRFDIHITQTVAPLPGLRSTSSIALITCIHSETLSLGLPSPIGRSVYPVVLDSVRPSNELWPIYSGYLLASPFGLYLLAIPSQPPPQLAEHEPEPNVTEPLPKGATARRIATEPEPIPSDQVREPATLNKTVDVSVECAEGAEESTAAEDVYEDMPPLLPPSSACHELSACLDFSPTLVSPGSPSAHPQSTICAVGVPLVCQSPSVSWLEDPSSPPPDSEFWTPPRLHPGSQLSFLHRRLSAHQLWLRFGWSSSRHRLGTPLLWLRLITPLGSSPPPAPP
ncbi:Translation initiation factor IF-2 [Labeo rohita]|uniref:Translation initiation factor IF-2 n=1 Tax=Labeo rohita TaxID=84645 RepID=A0ABQ8MAZ9_LABRO|nr:Translation initiation factor IF-2 [Labeo rohita]